MFRFTMFSTVAAFALLFNANSGWAQSASQYLAQAQSYETTAKSLEARAQYSAQPLKGQMLAQAQQLRQYAQVYRQQAARMGGGQSSGQPAPRPSQPAFDAAKIAQQANQAWLNRVNGMRPGRNGGFLIYFSNPPIYQGDTRFTPNARPYFARPYEMYRVLSMMTNNRQRVDNITAY